MSPTPDPDSARGRQIRQASLAAGIPMLMAAGPLVGYGLGWAAQRYLGAPGWIIPAAVVLGLVAGMRQAILLIRRLSR